MNLNQIEDGYGKFVEQHSLHVDCVHRRFYAHKMHNIKKPSRMRERFNNTPIFWYKRSAKIIQYSTS